MSKSKPTSVVDLHKEVLRRRGREQYLADLREGRRQRATTIPSGKAYKRRARTSRKED